MNINLKSAELRKFFGNNGVLTEQIANARFNNMTIELVNSPDGNLSQELIDDLENIRRVFPKLLRHTRIINNTDGPIDMQPIMDVIAKYPSRNRLDTIQSISITSKYDEDYDLDFSRIYGVKTITLSGGSRVSKVTFNSSLLPRNPNEEFKLELSNFDLTGLNLSGTKVRELSVKGVGTKNFSRVQGLDVLHMLGIEQINSNSKEFQDMIAHVNSSRSICKLLINNVDLSDKKPLTMITSPNLAQIKIINSKLKDLEGIDKWDGKLIALDVRGNNLGENDIPALVNFAKRNTMAEVSFSHNDGIKKYFDSISTEPFSNHTTENINRSLLTIDGKRVIGHKEVLQKLADDPTIPISIVDADVIRRQAGLTLNPIEVPEDVDVTKFDFNKDYLRDGTLLLTIKQIESLRKANMKVPMKLAVKIESAKDLTAEQIKDLHFNMGVSEVRMLNYDGVNNTRAPYSAVDYYHLRQILDEVVSGIKPGDFDADKFAVIYKRLADTLIYDQRAVRVDNASNLRYSGIHRDNCRNLRNGLLEGTCVCAGFAEILRNSLDLVGIKSRYIVGTCFKDKDMPGRHAWNAVELTDQNGKKQWYLTDLTWDAGRIPFREDMSVPDSRVMNNLLIDERTFRANGHQVDESYDLPIFAQEPYNRERLKKSFKEAEKVALNPREEYRKKREERKKAVAAKKDDDKKKSDDDKKKSDDDKKKSDDDKKKSDDKKPSEELQALIDKRDKCRKEMDMIYHRLDTTLGLDSYSKKEYYKKLTELEERYKKLVEKVDSYEEEKPDETKPDETKPPIKSTGEDKVELTQEYKDEIYYEVEEFKEKISEIVVQRQEAIKNNDIDEERKLHEEEVALVTEIGLLQGSLETLSDEEKEGKKIEREELASKLNSIMEQMENAKQNNDIKLERNLAQDRLSIVEQIGKLSGSIEPVEYDGVVRQKGVDPKKTEPLKEDEPEMPDIQIKSEEQIKKDNVLSEDEIKQREEFEKAAREITKQKIVPVIKSREDLIEAKKQTLRDKIEKGYLKLSNKVLRREDQNAPKVIKGVIKFAVNARFWVEDGIRKVFKLDDKYEDELNAINKGKAVEYERKKDLVEKKRLTYKNEHVSIDSKKVVPEKEVEDLER